MCGIAGILTSGESVNPALLGRMTSVLKHRGPDDSGYFLAQSRGSGRFWGHDGDTIAEVRSRTSPVGEARGFDVGFGFRRLSILDVTAAGHQPMASPDGRYTIVYNGEIYNFLELRRELESGGWEFRSTSDTEVLLAAYVRWGRSALDRLNGMWAFAIWDDRDKTLFASRDRFGVKPFYYFWDGRRFMFASEIKALLEAVPAEADSETVAAFLAHDRLNDTDRTFFKGIRELRGSHCLTLTPAAELKIERYYRVPSDQSIDAKDPAGAFREIFLDAVRLRMRSDVPVGYALSGGIDSSAITVAAARFAGTGSATQKTFSTVYPGRSEDESGFIDAVVRKTRFESLRATPESSGLLRDVDAFVWHQEEPSNSASYYAEFVLRRLERAAGVTVSLDGQGADELLCGYDQQMPAYVGDVAARRGWFAAWEAARRSADFRNAGQGQAATWLALGLGGSAADAALGWRRGLVRGHLNPDLFRRARVRSEAAAEDARSRRGLDRRLHDDLIYSSQPHQLVRADKSSMAFSVECRFPFLDVRLVELAFSLPADVKVREGVSKWVLREAMKADLPEEVYSRRDKKGFPAPQADWLRTELRGWVDSWVYSDTMKRLPWIRWKNFEASYRQFRDHGRVWDRELWMVLSTALWTAKFMERKKLS